MNLEDSVAANKIGKTKTISKATNQQHVITIWRVIAIIAMVVGVVTIVIVIILVLFLLVIYATTNIFATTHNAVESIVSSSSHFFPPITIGSGGIPNGYYKIFLPGPQYYLGLIHYFQKSTTSTNSMDVDYSTTCPIVLGKYDDVFNNSITFIIKHVRGTIYTIQDNQERYLVGSTFSNPSNATFVCSSSTKLPVNVTTAHWNITTSPSTISFYGKWSIQNGL